MFEIGDYVVNATNGICQIKEVVKMDLSGGKQEKEYFYLEPVDEKSAKAYIPLDIAPTRIRKVIDAKKATEVISAVDSIEELLVSSEREREAIYKAAIKSCEPTELVAMIKNIFRRKKERLEAGKKITAVDERYCKLADGHLYSELAFALEKTKDEIRVLLWKTE